MPAAGAWCEGELLHDVGLGEIKRTGCGRGFGTCFIIPLRGLRFKRLSSRERGGGRDFAAGGAGFARQIRQKSEFIVNISSNLQEKVRETIDKEAVLTDNR